LKVLTFIKNLYQTIHTKTILKIHPWKVTQACEQEGHP
jgi:hypothetical protein